MWRIRYILKWWKEEPQPVTYIVMWFVWTILIAFAKPIRWYDQRNDERVRRNTVVLPPNVVPIQRGRDIRLLRELKQKVAART